MIAPIRQQVLLWAMMPMIFSGCITTRHPLEPTVRYEVTHCDVERVPSAFPPLSEEERATEWGKELYIGEHFAKEMDLYQALTAFKRALILLPEEHEARLLQLQYSIIQVYYLGEKYWEAIEVFEGGALIEKSRDFPALRELLIMMYDAYEKTCQTEKANCLITLIDKADPSLAAELQLSTFLVEGDLITAKAIASCTKKEEPVSSFIHDYCCRRLSPQKAQLFNAFLPGAGYYYVGQQRSAVTSFIINTLFIWATTEFFRRGYVAAGLLTASLETGWYFGGINGAGLAAKEYNEHLYNSLSKGMMIRNNLFPVLLFETSF